MQIILVALALASMLFAQKGSNHSSRIVAGILAILWLWMGVVYHWLFFSSINGAAIIFGAIFVLQAVLFLSAGVSGDELSFRFRPDLSGATGILLMIYALVIYPVLGFVFGHKYPHSPTFGLPCPTVIFTFGLLLWTNKRVPLYILLIPFAWSLLGFSAAFLFGMFEDVGLVIAGFMAVSLLLWRRKMENRIAP